MEVRWNDRLLGVLEPDGRLVLDTALSVRPPDDPWVLWATALGQQTIGRPPATRAELADRAREARADLLPAAAFADAFRREPDRGVLAEILGLPVEILEDRLRDMDVALLTARPLRGRPKR